MVSGGYVGCFCFCLGGETQGKRERDADFNKKNFKKEQNRIF